MKCWIELSRSGDATQKYDLTSKVSVLGTAGESHVRLPALPGLGPSHLELELDSDGCIVTPLVEQHGLTKAGHPFVGGLLEWEQELYFFGLRLRLRRDSTKSERPSPVLLGALVLALGWLGFTTLGTTTVSGGHGEVAAPALFEEVKTCPASEQAAFGQGQRLLELARAKKERSVFVARDGVEAVQFASQAATCFELAGRDDERTGAEHEASEWRNELEQDYRDHQLRLSLARKNDQPKRVETEIRALQALLDPASQDATVQRYRLWLGTVQAEFEKAKRD